MTKQQRQADAAARTAALIKFWEDNPDAAVGDCDSYIADRFDTSRDGARGSRLRTFTAGQRPWVPEDRAAMAAQKPEEPVASVAPNVKKPMRPPKVPQPVKAAAPKAAKPPKPAPKKESRPKTPKKVKATTPRERQFADGDYPETKLPVSCPKTGVVATTLEDVDEIFGWRAATKDSEGVVTRWRVQSWSRDARTAHAREMRARRKQEALDAEPPDGGPETAS